MLEQAKKKLNDIDVKFILAFAENYPLKNYFDITTVSFGIRNFSNINKSLIEIIGP